MGKRDVPNGGIVLIYQVATLIGWVLLALCAALAGRALLRWRRM